MLGRRPRLALTALVGVGATALGACSTPVAHRAEPPAPAARTAPNIVFVLTDDLSSNLVRYMPHVQAMQRAGVTLSNYYVVDSLCCPSRAAIFTGEYPHNNGVKTNTSGTGGYAGFRNHGDDARTFAVTLHGAGYRTGLMGKYLNGYYPYDPIPPGWDQWDAAGRAYREYHYALNDSGTIRLYGKKPRAYLTDVLARKASRFIRSAGTSGQPFALEVATFAPHSPATPARRNVHDFPGLRAPRDRAFDRVPAHATQWLANVPPLRHTDKYWINKLFRLRVRSVQAVDAMVARLERTLTEQGLSDNTYFVFSSDNGFHMGEYRLRPGKQTAFDTDIRVPLIVTGPGVPAGVTVPEMASNIDLAPTFDRIAGAAVPPSVDGVSLLPLWQGRHPRPWQQAVLIEHLHRRFWLTDPDRQGQRSGDPPTYEAIRTPRALYVRYVDGEPDYFNTVRDPFELDNRYRTAPRRVLRPLQRHLTELAQCRGAAECQAAARMHS